MAADEERNGWDRARFDESLELATTQLALPLELDDEDREIGS